MNIYAAYGSSKDINVYQSAGIPLSKMYIVKPKNPKRKHQVTYSFFIQKFETAVLRNPHLVTCMTEPLIYSITITI